MDDPDDFEDSDGELWRENANGNFCRRGGGPPDGVIFRRSLGGWSGNSSRLGDTVFVKGGRDDPQEVAELILQGEAEGLASSVWAMQPGAWTPNKAGTGEWCWLAGLMVTVKRTTSRAGYPPSYFATVGQRMLEGPDGKPVWFRSLDDAKVAAENAARGSG